MRTLFHTHNSSKKSLFLQSDSSSSSGNMVYGSHNQIYQNLNVLKSLTATQFPVYLVNSRVTKLNYAMKVFIHENGHPHLYFKNETRFASLRHPNVIRHLFFAEKREAKIDDELTNISYTIMEYCPNGDFLNFLKNYRKGMDDKLIRTYFRQLLDGLEYLHKNDVSHMDIKLDNLLLDQDFNLKITDFDMAHYKDDAIIISNGTKYFRAPEVCAGRCNNTKAADIYSAGIILFILKANGVLPQFEDDLTKEVNFADLLYNNVQKFWMHHERLQKQSQDYFDEEFKEIFNFMTKLNPNERASIEEIKKLKWYNGPYYTCKELKEKMGNLLLQ